MQRVLPCLIFAVGVCFFSATATRAQTKSSIDLRITFGWRNTIAEGTCSEGGGHFMKSGQFVIGGSAQYHVSSRVRLGPELLFAPSCKRQTYTFYHPRFSGMMNVAMDLNRSTRAQPYLIAAFGIVRHKISGLNPRRYRWEGAGGVGAKLYVSDRTFVAPEAYLGGRVPFVKLSGSVGTVIREK